MGTYNNIGQQMQVDIRDFLENSMVNSSIEKAMIYFKYTCHNGVEEIPNKTIKEEGKNERSCMSAPLGENLYHISKQMLLKYLQKDHSQILYMFLVQPKYSFGCCKEQTIWSPSLKSVASSQIKLPWYTSPAS